MKNIFLTLAFMLISTFAFANTAEVETLEKDVKMERILNNYGNHNYQKIDIMGTCYLTINAYDADGNKIRSWVLAFENVDSAEECQNIRQLVANSLRK